MNTPQLPMLNPRAKSHQLSHTKISNGSNCISTPSTSTLQMEKCAQNSVSYDQNLNKLGKKKKKRTPRNIMDADMQFILEKGQINTNYLNKPTIAIKKRGNYDDLDPDNIFEQF